MKQRQAEYEVRLAEYEARQAESEARRAEYEAWRTDVNEERLNIFLGNLIVDYGKMKPLDEADENAEEVRVLNPASLELLRTEAGPVSLLSPRSPLTRLMVPS
jgi:hypothetical protein